MEHLLARLLLATLLLAIQRQQPASGWYFGAPPPPEPQTNPEPGQQEQPGADQQQRQETQDDDLIFLSDKEFVHNKKLINSLKNPKVAEELIDNNPVLEAMILKRLEAKLAREALYPYKKPYKNYGLPAVVHHGDHDHVHSHEHAAPVQVAPATKTDQQQLQEYLEDMDADQDEHEGEQVVVDKKKYDGWKEKLKTNAGKIFKMGSGFKEKYWALRKKYAKPTKGKEVEIVEHHYHKPEAKPKVKLVEKEKVYRIPKFYFEVSH